MNQYWTTLTSAISLLELFRDEGSFGSLSDEQAAAVMDHITTERIASYLAERVAYDQQQHEYAEAQLAQCNSRWIGQQPKIKLTAEMLRRAAEADKLVDDIMKDYASDINSITAQGR